MLAVMIGTDITGRFVQHEVANTQRLNDLAIHCHHIIRMNMLCRFACGFMVDRYRALANQLMNLRACQIRGMADKFIQSHGCSPFQLVGCQFVGSQLAGTAVCQPKRFNNSINVLSRGAVIWSGWPVTGCGKRVSVAANNKRCAWKCVWKKRLWLPLPCLASPIIGWLMCFKWRRIWCFRPVTGWQATKE